MEASEISARSEMKRRSGFISDYFRNPNEKKYTEEHLTYATPKLQAQKAALWMVSMLDVLQCGKSGGDVHVVEACGGIGCNTIEFCHCKSVRLVDSFEVDPKVFSMLKANVESEPKMSARANVHRGNFLQEWKSATDVSDGMRTCFFIDPPWGGADYWKSGACNPQLSNGIGLYGCTDLIEMLRHSADAVAFKLPMNFDMKTFDCFKEVASMRINKVNYVMLPLPAKRLCCRKRRRVDETSHFGEKRKKVSNYVLSHSRP